jgi:Zn-finger nucleic acid-binding protein
MQEETLAAHLGRPVTIDLCQACQSFWFDARESIGLTPGSTLALFRIIGERAARPQRSHADLAKCPRCRARLRPTHDMQRTTRFEYLRCPNGHGRLTTFFDFLREKDFIRPLTSQQVAELRESVQSVNCANCGAPVDLARGATCEHCDSPLSMLDITHAEKLVHQLQSAEDRTIRPVDPSLPLDLARARREVEAAFAGSQSDDRWSESISSSGLVGAGLKVMVRWLKGQA